MTTASTHKIGIVCLCAGVLAMTGCATKTIVLPPPPLADRIPSQLLACRERPVAGELTRQSDVARYVVDLDAAGEDCRRKLRGIKGIVQRDVARTGDAR